MDNNFSKNSLNILSVNYKWFQIGGDWTYIENVNKLYQELGHKVIPFSMKNERNVETYGFDKYFVDYVDYKILNKKKNIRNAITAVARSIYSKEAKRNMERLLEDTKIDIAHFHNINRYITPSIISALKKRNIPIVWTLHDYTLICPENSFISNGKICEKCKGGRFIECGINKCKKNSYLASSLAAIENYVTTYSGLLKHVDYFLCPSEFLYNKFYEFNFYREKLVVLNNCFKSDKINEGVFINSDEKYILYVGRLEKIKGVTTLLNAIKGLKYPLKIVGSGNLMPDFQQFIKDNKMENVELLGHKPLDEVYQLIKNAQFTVCPSEWYENYPFSVIEAMYFKKAIIGARIGGIPELLIDGNTGILFEPFNAEDLREKIELLWNNEELKIKLGENAFNFISKQVSFERHYSILKDVFKKLNFDL